MARRSESEPVRFLRDTPSSVAYSICVRLFDRLFDIVAVSSSALHEGTHETVRSVLNYWYIKVIYSNQCVFGQEEKKDLYRMIFGENSILRHAVFQLRK